MPLPSLFKRTTAEARNPPADSDGSAVDVARTRARRRLIGAVVLLAVGVVGFPLVFETQPRPVATDIPIETPRKEPGAAPAPGRQAAARTAPVVTEPPVEPPAPAASAAPEPPIAVAKVEPKVEPKPDAKPEARPEPKPEAKPEKPAPKADDGQRAKALLDGAAPASAAKGDRFVVQVGAYTDSADVREARAKVEKLGFVSYTQVIDSDSGKRTRVRVGPFASREEADKVSAKLKGAGLPVHIFKL